LRKVVNYYRIQGDLSALSDYIALMDTKVKSKNLRPIIMQQKMLEKLRDGEYQNALAVCDHVISTYPGEEAALNAICDKAVIYKEYLDDKPKAIEMYKDFIASSKDTAAIVMAIEELASMGEIYQHPAMEQQTELALNEGFSADNYPNPFNPLTTITFTIPYDDKVVVKIYDIAGRLVRTLLDEQRIAGMHSMVWDSRNAFGAEVASGMYIYQIVYRGKVMNKKLLLVR
jgi:hypothetical protein